MSDATSHSPARNGAPRRRGFLQRSSPLVAALVVVFALVLADGRLKTSPLAGYCPEDATWVAVSGDLGQFWRGVETSDTFVRLHQEGFNPLNDTVLSIRKQLGIRLTPVRWGTWFGQRFTAAQSGAGTGFCVRPGILLRALGYYNRLRNGGPSENGVYAWGDLVYGWRDGFLVISPSSDYVLATLDDSAQTLYAAQESNALHIRWCGDPEWDFTIGGEQGLPLAGTIPGTFEKRDTPLTLADTWPEPPLLAVSGTNPQKLAALAMDLAQGLPNGDFIAHILDEMGKALSKDWKDWAEGGSEYAFALVGLDTSEALPVPEMALVLRGPKLPFLPEAPQGAIPFEWGGSPGWVNPWMGEKLSRCVGQHERDRYFANQEPILAGLLGQMKTGQNLYADLAVTLDWTKFAAAATALLTSAADNELLPRMNRDDVERKILPYLEMLAHLGTLRIQGRSEGSLLRIEGYLTSLDDDDVTAQGAGKHAL